MDINPMLSAPYVAVLFPHDDNDPLPAAVRARARALVAERNEAPESELDRIDRDLVSILRPHIPEEV